MGGGDRGVTVYRPVKQEFGVRVGWGASELYCVPGMSPPARGMKPPRGGGVCFLQGMSEIGEESNKGQGEAMTCAKKVSAKVFPFHLKQGLRS